MVNIICAVVIMVVCIGLSHERQQTLKFNDCVRIYYANNDKDYQLSWTGEYTGHGCKVTFKGRDYSNALDEYKICIKAVTWDIQRSDARLEYYSDDDVSDYDLQKTFTKYSYGTPETEWCSESDEYVHVQLSTRTVNSGTIKLKVYAIKTKDYEKETNNYGKTTGIIMASIIGGVVLLGTIVTVVIVFACNRRRGASGTVLTTQNMGGQIISSTQTDMQPMAGFQNNAFYSQPPSYDEATGYTYSGQQYAEGQMVPNKT